jgi:hypothetical protein
MPGSLKVLSLSVVKEQQTLWLLEELQDNVTDGYQRRETSYGDRSRLWHDM